MKIQTQEEFRGAKNFHNRLSDLIIKYDNLTPDIILKEMDIMLSDMGAEVDEEEREREVYNETV